MSIVRFQFMRENWYRSFITPRIRSSAHDFISNMSEVQNSLPLKVNRGKRSGTSLSSSNMYLSTRKPPRFPKLPASQDAGTAANSRSASVIQEADEEEEKRNARKMVVENTYMMEPDKKFSSAAVHRIAKTILTEKLSDVVYDPKVCRDLSLEISDEILLQVKQLGFDRYKIVCITHIGQKSRQSIHIGSMCCWDKETDNFSEYSFVNDSLFAVTMVFGTYQE